MTGLRNRLPEQRCRLHDPVSRRRRDAAHACCRSQASVCRDRLSSRCCTPGARRSIITRISTASCWAADCRRTGPAGWLARQTSSCPCAFCHACSGGWFSTNSNKLTPEASFSSSVILPAWPVRPHSTVLSKKRGKSIGSSMPSRHLPDPNRCWPISGAIPIALPSIESHSDGRIIERAAGKR